LREKYVNLEDEVDREIGIHGNKDILDDLAGVAVE